MPKITILTEDERRKYKVRKQYSIKYTCQCGAEIIYESDHKPDRLTNGKCWKCKEKSLTDMDNDGL
jgi:predicted SprT family Zn-dependent metalloprotease